MRRALILIITLTLLSFGSGFYLDRYVERTAQEYQRELETLRQSLLSGRWQDAKEQEHFLHARWQQDARRLKLIISHDLTREVSRALLRLSTGLDRQWTDEALPALDEAQTALTEIGSGHLPLWENVL